jgi:hypothetical protein
VVSSCTLPSRPHQQSCGSQTLEQELRAWATIPLSLLQSPEASWLCSDPVSVFRIWPIEVSRELPPSARLDGFDISPDQYPLKEWLPPNVHLYTHDAFTPFPATYIGQYDVVHLRFFLTLLNTGEKVATLIENLMALLSTCFLLGRASFLLVGSCCSTLLLIFPFLCRRIAWPCYQ